MKLFFACTLLTLSAGSLSAALITLNTGAAAWSASGPNVVGTVNAANLGANPNGVWLPAPAGSQWISTVATDGTLPPDVSGVPGTYTFSLSFTTDALGGSINYQTAGDNEVTIVVTLDGVPISTFAHPGNLLTDSSSGAQGCAFLPPGSSLCNPPNTSQGMVGPGTIIVAPGGAGTIVITATVINSQPPSPSPVGFLLAGEADMNSYVPEPSSLGTLASGIALIALGKRRFSRASA